MKEKIRLRRSVDFDEPVILRPQAEESHDQFCLREILRLRSASIQNDTSMFPPARRYVLPPIPQFSDSPAQTAYD